MQSFDVFHAFNKKRCILCNSTYISDSDPYCSFQLGRTFLAEISLLRNPKLTCKRKME
eukprot:c40880_g1_i1 orf=37-210(-)